MSNRRYFITHKPRERFSWKWGDWDIIKSWRLTFPLSRPHWQPQEIPHPVESVCGPVAVLDTIDQLRNTVGLPEATCVLSKKRKKKNKGGLLFLALHKQLSIFFFNHCSQNTNMSTLTLHSGRMSSENTGGCFWFVHRGSKPLLFNNIIIKHPSWLSSSRCGRDLLLPGRWRTGLQMQQRHWQKDVAMQAHRFIHEFWLTCLCTNEANRLKSDHFFLV